MGAVDPTYPLYPIACILASAMLLLVLTTSFVRQSWNLGVTFLCFWIFLELVTAAVSAIVWSDNADIRLYVYCDIVTHIEEITYVVKPMATLIVTRRLYLIASLRSVELPDKAARHWDLALEWTLGLIIPILVAGPLYYVNEGARFEIVEGFGCRTADQTSILDIMMVRSWIFVPPLISVIFYYRESFCSHHQPYYSLIPSILLAKVARTYYRQRRDIDSFLRSNTSVSRTNYLRILVLASIDILLTLPVGIVTITLAIVQARSSNTFLFYPGWTLLHTDWDPIGISYVEQRAAGIGGLAQFYFSQWSSTILAFVIFGLFGVTPEARVTYWRIICAVGGWFGWKPTPRARNGQASLGDIEFGARPAQDTSGIDLEMGSRTPSFINADVHAAAQGSGNASGAHATPEETDLEAGDETRHEFTGDAVSHTENRVSNVEESSGVSAMRESQSDHTSVIVSDVPRTTDYPKSTVM
ncbi:hypothetical protein PENSPDRAFT_694699 [Peniophora sp. CONT]|nr:hypothetical protein PENSPDRAFT_694699 [Peniophora sp. CONT]